MDLDRFTRCLDTYGADFRRWPDSERAAGERLRDSSAEARRRWEDARRLDALFALDRTMSASAQPHAAITDAALRRIRSTPRRASLDLSWLRRRPMGAALGASLLAGLLAGFFAGPVLQASPALPPTALGALLDAGNGDLEGLLQ